MEHATWPARVVMLLLSALLVLTILAAQKGRTLFVRRIPGLTAIEDAVGRAVEMGRGLLLSVGLGGIDIVTLQALAILTNVASSAARFGARILLPVTNAGLMAIAEDALSNAYAQAGRPDAFNANDLIYLSGQQFAYAAGVAGIINREQPAAAFYFGTFYAESLILAENANQIGAIQVAGTPSTTQVPFFIAACDYVIIGDEFYAATAYITRQPTLMGSLVGQDRAKMALLALLLLGVVLTLFPAFRVPVIYNLFGSKDLPTARAYFQEQSRGGGR